MTIEDTLAEIEGHITTIGGYHVFVIEDESKLDNDTYIEHPVLDLEIEDDEREINLLTTHLSNDNRTPITVDQLHMRLKEIGEQCSGYHMYSASSVMDLDEDYSARLDVPLIAIGQNHKENKLAFVQQKAKKPHNKAL